MTTATLTHQNGQLARPASSSLADVLDVILDKGLVIDAYVRISLVGIELLTIDARIVVASVDTYLRFANAVNRLQIGESGQKPGLPELVEGVGHTVKRHQLKEGLRKPVDELRRPVDELKKPLRAARRMMHGRDRAKTREEARA